MKPVQHNDPQRLWDSARSLPPLLHQARVEAMINDFPAVPPPPASPFLSFLKTKWIMYTSVLSLFFALLSFAFLPDVPDQEPMTSVDNSTMMTNELRDAKLAINDRMGVNKVATPLVTQTVELPKAAKVFPNRVVPVTSGSKPATQPKPEQLITHSDRRSSALSVSPISKERLIQIPTNPASTLVISNWTESDTITPKMKQARALNGPEKLSGPVPLQMNSTGADREIDAPILVGKWQLSQDHSGRKLIRYRWKEKSNGNKVFWDHVDGLNTDNHSSFQNTAAPPVISRSMGRLYLETNNNKGNKGTFVFYLDQENAERLTAAGAGPAQTPDELFKASGFPKGVSGTLPSVPRPDVNSLWFRYFLEDVDNDFFNILAEYGYTSSELSQTWALVNNRVDKKKLASVLPKLKIVLTERLPLGQLADLMIMPIREKTLDALIEYGYKKRFTADQLSALDFWPSFNRSVHRLAEMGYTDVPAEDLITIQNKFINLNVLERKLALLDERPPLRELLNNYHENLIDLPSLPGSSTNLIGTLSPGMESPHAWGTSCTEPAIFSQELAPFKKVVARGNIRVVIRQGDQHLMTTIAQPGKEKLVRMDVKDGVLYLSPPKGPDKTFNYDIQITAKSLERVVAKTTHCVWVDQDFRPIEIRGHFCRIKNFENWVSDGL